MKNVTQIDYNKDFGNIVSWKNVSLKTNLLITEEPVYTMSKEPVFETQK